MLIKIHTDTVVCCISVGTVYRQNCVVLSLLLELRVNVCGAVCFLLQVWDGVSNRCISVFPKAHAGAEVCMIGYIYVCVCVPLG